MYAAAGPTAGPAVARPAGPSWRLRRSLPGGGLLQAPAPGGFPSPSRCPAATATVAAAAAAVCGVCPARAARRRRSLRAALGADAEARPAAAEVLDTVEGCQAAVAQLLLEKEVAIDIEGVDLSRQGEVCIIQAFGPSSPAVYLFDIHVLGESAFGGGGLRALLEAEQVTKLFYDVRGDCDALQHLHGVRVRGAYDVQVLWHVRFQHPDDSYLQGLKKVQALFLEESKVLTQRSIEAVDHVKEEGLKLFLPELGGSYDVWKQRPLCPELLEYAASDIRFLLDMRSLWAAGGDSADPSAEPVQLDGFVRTITDERLSKYVESPDAAALDFSRKKFRDFEIPPGFNETGAVSEQVPVPSHKRGRVIGKKGATRQAIEAQSGARVVLEDGKTYALVIGHPDQVQAAARLIRAKCS